MDEFRVRRRLKSSNRSSGDTLGLTEGNRQVRKQRDPPNFVSDSSSCSSGSTIDDSVTFERAWRSSNQALGTPMKKLLAVEMSKETEPKKGSPSVIARLMGLDGLPPQQHAHKRQNAPVENYQQRSTYANRAPRRGTTSGRRLSRSSSKNDQEFKDVFEVLDASKMDSCSYPSQRTAKPNLSDAEMAFIQQKFMDAKRLSSHENLLASKEFNDALEVLDSNKDLLLKFLEQPDSLFTKHLQDLQRAPPPPQFARTSAMKSSYISKCEHSFPGQKQDRETSWKNHNKSPQRHHELHNSQSSSKRAAKSTNKSSNGKVENKFIAPTRIVVLKPNIGKALNVTGTDLSPRSSHDFLSDCGKPELLGVRNREADLWGKKNQSDDGHKSRESRQIAKEITRQMRESFSKGSVNFPASKFKECGVESQAHAILEGDSSDESSVLTILTSRDTLDWSNRHKPSSSRSTESSVSREAKKRLSERWKMTHKSQEIRVLTRGSSTLGEMLAIPDKDARSANRDSTIACDGSVGWVEPLGISSRDGWMDGHMSNLPRSRSLPSSFATLGSPKTSMCCENFRGDRYVIPKDSNKRESKKGPRRKSDQREFLSSRKSRCSRQRSHSSGCSDRESSGRESSDSSPERHFGYSQEKSTSKLKTDGSPEYNCVMTEDISADISLVSSNTDLEQVTETTCSKPSFSEPENIVISSQDILDGKSKEVPFTRPVPDLDSPSSSKEADQPSPLSILEAPFTDDVSSCSDCFESLSADLHGLRMQLQLLKSESELHAEQPMFIYGDEDTGEGSIMFSSNSAEEDWESSYIIDGLTESGLQNADPDMFLSTMHSPECPVNPLTFEELEKKYCEMISGSRSERRLMFDRINSKLLDLYQQFADPRPWTRLGKRFDPRWKNKALGDSLRRSLLSEDRKVKMDAHEKGLGSESEWLELGDEIDKIGKEMERVLIDELVVEMVMVVM